MCVLGGMAIAIGGIALTLFVVFFGEELNKWFYKGR